MAPFDPFAQAPAQDGDGVGFNPFKATADKTQPDADTFDYASSTEEVITDYQRAVARLSAAGVDPDTVDGRPKDPWYMKGIKTLTGLGVALDWLFLDAPVRTVLGGITGLLQGKGLESATMQGAEVDRYAAQEDYNELIGKGGDWHAPTGKELLLMWGLMDQSEDRKGKVDLIDVLGIGLEMALSPADWFSGGASQGAKAGVKGGTTAIRATADNIMRELGEAVAKNYSDDMLELVAKNFDNVDVGKLRKLLERAAAPVDDAMKSDIFKLVDRLGAVEELDKYGLLDNLDIGGKAAKSELEVARSGLFPSAEELAYMMGAESYGSDVQRVMRSLSDTTDAAYKANDAFKELSLRAYEKVYEDFGGLKFGLPGHQMSKTGKGSVSIIKQRTINEKLAKMGLTGFVENWKRSIPGRTMMRTFVSDWRLDQLKSVDEGLANQLKSLKHLARTKADNELHTGINGLVKALQGLGRKSDRIDFLHLMEAPGELSAVLKTVVDDSGITGLREALKAMGADPKAVLSLIDGDVGLQRLFSHLDDSMPGSTDELLRAVRGAADSDGARFATDVFQGFDELKEISVTARRRALCEELGFVDDAGKVRIPSRLIDDLETGKRIPNPERAQLDNLMARFDPTSEDAIAAVLADSSANGPWAETVQKVLKAHEEFSTYRVPKALDMNGITQDDLARAVMVFARDTDKLDVHERADLIISMVADIDSRQAAHEKAVMALTEQMAKDYGGGVAGFEEMVKNLHTGEYAALRASGETGAELLAGPTEDASKYAKMALAVQDASDIVADSRRQIDCAVYELMAVLHAPVDGSDKLADSILRQQMSAFSDLTKNQAQVGTHIVAGGTVDVEQLVGAHVRLGQLDGVVDDSTMFFYATRNASVDDSARVFGFDATEQIRKVIDDDPELLLSGDQALVHHGKSAIRDIYYMGAEDLEAVRAMPLQTGDVGDLKVPAVKLFASPLDAEGDVVRVSVASNKVAIIDAADLGSLTSPRSKVNVITERGTKKVRMVDLVDQGYDAVYVRKAEGTPARVYALPDADSFHSAMSAEYAKWEGQGLPSGYRNQLGAPSHRPLLVNYRDPDTGELVHKALAGYEAANLREAAPNARALSIAVKKELGIDQATRISIKDVDAYVGGVRVLEFDPATPRNYKAGTEQMRELLDAQPDLATRSPALASEAVTEALQEAPERAPVSNLASPLHPKGAVDFDLRGDTHVEYFKDMQAEYGDDFIPEAEFNNMNILYDPKRKVGVAVRIVEEPKKAAAVVEEAVERVKPTMTRRAAGEYVDQSGIVTIVHGDRAGSGGLNWYVMFDDGKGNMLSIDKNIDPLPSPSFHTLAEARDYIETDMVDDISRKLSHQDMVDALPKELVDTYGLKVRSTTPTKKAATAGKYIIEAPINNSGVNGASAHAFLQAVNPLVREGGEVSVNMPKVAGDMIPFLEAMGFDTVSETKNIVKMTLDNSKWADFISRNPKALTKGIIEDLVDGEGIEYIRYAVPLDEADEELRSYALRSVQMELQLREQDRKLYEAFQRSEFENISKEWAEGVGLKDWELLNPETQEAIRAIYSGTDELGASVNLTSANAAVASEWADAAHAMSDSLHLPREVVAETPGISTDVAVESYQKGRFFAEGVDPLSEHFIMQSDKTRKMEMWAYSFMPADMTSQQKRSKAAVFGMLDHYRDEAVDRGIASKDIAEHFKEVRTLQTVDIGGKAYPIAPGLSQEAVNKVNEMFGSPGAWVAQAKKGGFKVALKEGDEGLTFAEFTGKLWKTSKEFYESVDEFDGLEGARRLEAQRVFIGRSAGMSEPLWHSIDPQEWLLPAYEYIPHTAADLSDVPLWRRITGAFRDVGQEDVNSRVFFRPPNTKMENFQMGRKLNGTIQEINDVVGYQMFHDDPAKAMAIYIQRSVKAITNYDMIHEMLYMRDTLGRRIVMPAQYSDELAEWVAPRGYKMFSMNDVEKVGGDVDKLSEIFDDISDEVRASFEKHGRVKLMAREEIVDEFERASRNFFGDETFAANMRYFDEIQGVWKTYATVLRPGFHVRNALSNVWMNLYAGVNNPAHYKQAFDVQVVGNKIEHYILEQMMEGKVITDVHEAYQEMARAGLLEPKNLKLAGTNYNYGELYAIMKENGTIGTGRVGSDIHVFTEQQLSRLRPASRYGNPLSQAWYPTTAGRKFGETVENNARVAHFISMFDTTGDRAAAAWSVRKYLFDYNDLTDTERHVLRRGIPFYAWLRKNAELEFDTLVHRPMMITSAVRIQTSLNKIDTTEYKPEWVDELGGFALPGVTLGSLNKLFNTVTGGLLDLDETNQQPMYVALGLPYLDLARYNTKDLLSGMSPIIKAPIEIVNNHNLFFDKPIEEYRGQLTKAPSALVGMDESVNSFASPETKQAWDRMLNSWGVYRNKFTGDIMTGVWFSYIWKQANPHLEAWGKGMPNKDPDFLMDFINFWTGVKFMPIDETQSGYYTEKDKLQQAEDAIRAAKQRGIKVPKWSDLPKEEETPAWP